MPWMNCGNDWGVSYDKSRWEQTFAKYHNSGADNVRIWIHFDGAKQLNLYDKSGKFKVLPDNYFSDAEHTFNTAK